MNKVLIINASPRKNKNCDKISKEISSRLDLNDINNEIFNIYDMNIEYCNACGFCEKTGYCRIKDDMSTMYDKFNKSIGCIVVSPVNFDTVTAKMTTLVGRTNAFYASKYVLKKPSIDRSKKRIGMYIAVGGSIPYETQFKGGQIIMDFFFKSINTKLLHNLNIHSTDNLPFEKNEQFNSTLNEELKKYINELVK